MGIFRRRREVKVLESTEADPRAEEFISYGFTAATKGGDPSNAEGLFTQAMSLGNSEQKIRAARYMGIFLFDKNREASRRGYLYVLETGGSEDAPEAALGLAQSYEKEDDDVTARKYYERAIKSGHPIIGPRAAVILAERLENLGKTEEAIRYYMFAAPSENEDSAATALVALHRLNR